MLNKLILDQKISILWSRYLNRFFNVFLVFMLVYNFSNWFQSIGLKMLIHEALLCVTWLIKTEYRSTQQVCKEGRILFFGTNNIFFPQFSFSPSFSTSLSEQSLLPSLNLDFAVRGIPLWTEPSTSTPLRSDLVFLKQSSTFSWECVHELVAHDGSLTCVRKTLGNQRAEDRISQVTNICSRIRGKINKNKGKNTVDVWQKTTKFCKAIILHLKK